MTHNTVRTERHHDDSDPFFDFIEVGQPHPLQPVESRYAALTKIQPGKRARRILRPVY